MTSIIQSVKKILTECNFFNNVLKGVIKENIAAATGWEHLAKLVGCATFF